MKTLPACLTQRVNFVPAEGGTSKWVEAIFFAPRNFPGCAHHGQRAWMERRHLQAARALGWTMVMIREADRLPDGPLEEANL